MPQPTDLHSAQIGKCNKQTRLLIEHLDLVCLVSRIEKPNERLQRGRAGEKSAEVGRFITL